MPQMSPLWWTTLFLMFIMSLMIMWTIMYYMKSMEPMTKSILKGEKTMMNWKW